MSNNRLDLLDVNGRFGCGPYGSPDFASASELLTHMDRLGIARCLACHQEAPDLNPTWGNRRLLEEIAAADGASDRLIPAFTISPPMICEHGAMEHLKEHLQSGRVKALRIFPGTCRFDIYRLERVLTELVTFDPVLFWDVRDGGKDRPLDFSNLAAEFPSMHFVLTQGMWGEFDFMMDLLWRNENILIDISWLHMRDTIELLVKEFGPRRVLFGSGRKAHNGAAIGTLAQARIDNGARNLIAHGNAERLLNLPPSDPGTAEGFKDDSASKPLWTTLRQGGRPAGVDIVDAHGHLGPPCRGWFIPDIEIGEQIANLISQMDQLGIARSIVSSEPALFGHPVSGNRLMQDALQPYRDRFMGYLTYNPYYAKELDPLLDDFFAGEIFVGFKILGDYWKTPIDNPCFNPVWEYANRHALPILIHTWEGAYDAPSMLTDIAPRYPDATFLLGHSGGGDRGRHEAEELALASGNVILEWCGSFCSGVCWEETIAKVGIDRIVFGTDTSFHGAAWELSRLLSLSLPDDELVPILGANMRRILARRE